MVVRNSTYLFMPVLVFLFAMLMLGLILSNTLPDRQSENVLINAIAQRLESGKTEPAYIDLTVQEKPVVDQTVSSLAMYMSSLPQSCLDNKDLKPSLKNHIEVKYLGLDDTGAKLPSVCGKEKRFFADIDRFIDKIEDIIKNKGPDFVDWLLTMLLG